MLAAVGVNVTLTVQADPAARVPRQLLVWANPMLVTETAEMVSGLPTKIVEGNELRWTG